MADVQAESVAKRLDFGDELEKQGAEPEAESRGAEEPKKKKKKKKKRGFAFIKKGGKKKAKKKAEAAQPNPPKSAENSGLSSSSNIKMANAGLMENSMDQTLETINRDLDGENVDEVRVDSSESKAQEERSAVVTERTGKAERLATREHGEAQNDPVEPGEPEQRESEPNSNILDDIQSDRAEQQRDSDTNQGKTDEQGPVQSETKEADSGTQMSPGEERTDTGPAQEAVNESSKLTEPERVVTAELEEESHKLEKLLYKLKGDFRSKILREKNVKVWKEYFEFFKLEFGFMMSAEAAKKQRLSDLNELQRANTQTEQEMIESLEKEDQSRADECQQRLAQLETRRLELQAQMGEDDRREEEYAQRGRRGRNGSGGQARQYRQIPGAGDQENEGGHVVSEGKESHFP